MGSVFSKPKTPDPPPPPEAPPEPPKDTDPEVKKARSDRRRRAALASGRTSTILTSPQGLLDEAPGATGGKTLLGS